MGEWSEIPEILRHSKADIAVWLLTMMLTVVTDLTFAVEVGKEQKRRSRSFGKVSRDQQR